MTTTQLQITLPEEAVQRIQSRVSSGEFSSPSELILEGLSIFDEEGDELEAWLQQETARRCEQSDRFPERRLSAAQVRQALDERFSDEPHE